MGKLRSQEHLVAGKNGGAVNATTLQNLRGKACAEKLQSMKTKLHQSCSLFKPASCLTQEISRAGGLSTT